MRQCILLYGKKHERDLFLYVELLRKGFNILLCNGAAKPNILTWIFGACRAIFISKRTDIIICYFDFQAVLCFWLCKLLLIERNIIAINIMLKKKKTFKNRLVSILYKKALSSNKCLASVTSTAYGHSLNKELGIEHNYFLIRDLFYEPYKQHNDFLVNKSTVFCGGHNGRDWRFILEIAKSMPDVQFNLVMPKKVYDKYKLSITENINVSYNISYKDFLDAICHSSLVCLPLDTEAPAGLIVMFQAAANKKFVITTDTVTTQEYITENRGLRLKNNLNEWVESIRYFLNNKIIANEYADNLYFFLKHECSEERFVSEVEKMIKHLTVMGKL